MSNPFGPPQDSNLFSYGNIRKRMLQNVQAAKVDDQIFQVVQKAFENALQKENVVLSRPERQHLFAQILKSVLEDMVRKLDDRSGSN